MAGKQSVGGRDMSKNSGLSKKELKKQSNRNGGAMVFSNFSLWIIPALAVVVALALFLFKPQNPLEKELYDMITPLESTPLLRDLPEFRDHAHKTKFMWGTYRPQLYFGIRPRLPSSLLFGTMWLDHHVFQEQGHSQLRHACKHEDGLKTYGWSKHNGVDYGKHYVEDSDFFIENVFTKQGVEHDSRNLNDWFVRMRSESLPDSNEKNKFVSLFVYMENEGKESFVVEGMKSNPEYQTLRTKVTFDDNPYFDQRVQAKHQFRNDGFFRGGVPTSVSGHTEELGDFELLLASSTKLKGIVKDIHYLGINKKVHPGGFFDAKTIVEMHLSRGVRGNHDAMARLPDLCDSEPTFFAVQFIVRLPVELDFYFFSLDSGRPISYSMEESKVRAPSSSYDFFPKTSVGQLFEVEERKKAIMENDGFSTLIGQKEDSFDKMFRSRFNLELKNDKLGEILKAGKGLDKFSKYALSNMVGGIGYFYGESWIMSDLLSRNGRKSPVPNLAAPLYTGVPSRSFFPRGFMWDEGFHLLQIDSWDSTLSRSIISHWFDLMNNQGWIAREQILGPEARSRVPNEFIIQNTSNANPPTFLMVIERIVNRVQSFINEFDVSIELAGNNEAPGTWNVFKVVKQFLFGANVDPTYEEDISFSAKPSESATEDQLIEFKKDVQFLRRIWPRLVKWADWYLETQAGGTQFAFRWHGRDRHSKELNAKTLTSGLDDYPRASHPGNNERHVDLYCWIALMSDILSKIGHAVGEPYEKYDELRKRMFDMETLNKMHWASELGQYSDFGDNTMEVKLMRDRSGQMRRVSSVKKGLPKKKVVAEFVDHFGYVSLFPLIVKILPLHSQELSILLGKLTDTELLWTEYGLRSLSTTSSIYMKRNTEHDKPYWRGPIWININYLTLSALHHYGAAVVDVKGLSEKESSQASQNKALCFEIYKRLRINVVRNIYDQFMKTGYIWEQYNDGENEAREGESRKGGKGQGTFPFTGWSALVLLIMAEQY
eukprot:Nk52_evm5s2226 gene=Nk52_evmTU5s2226